MCLTVDEFYPKQNDGAIRYKVVDRDKFGFFSMFYYTDYRLGFKMVKKDEDVEPFRPDSRGFHLFVNLEDALNYYSSRFGCEILICKCEGFVAGGVWGICDYPFKSEIWKTVTPLKVYEK